MIISTGRIRKLIERHTIRRTREVLNRLNNKEITVEWYEKLLEEIHKTEHEWLSCVDSLESLTRLLKQKY